ncbi:MAG: NifB/NifX family molybdenum-iron cluster-binding protein [Thermodesulfobacteriota bacterium]|nr:NifB/NifX family molybdenum-iron cluster-binding protein [Thermodesulfobacteriota bacterium]
MGDTEFFYLYDFTDGAECSFVERRKNVAQDMDHAQSDKMKAIISLIDDAEIFVAQQKSPNFIKIAKQTKFQPVVVNVQYIQDILTLLQGEFENIYSYVERRKNGETFETIPELAAGS